MGDQTSQAAHLLKAIFPKRLSISDNFKENLVHLLPAGVSQHRSEQEPIYGKQNYIAYEALFRPSENITSLSISELSKMFYHLGAQEKFDALTLQKGLNDAKNFPVTLNISVKSALSPEFWNNIEGVLKNHNPQDIIFEILEHDVALDADISHLETLKELGFKFALDDFSIGESHKNRLAVFTDLIDYIKIDGPLVRAGLGDKNTPFTENDFIKLTDNLREVAPHTKLIAEHVNNAKEAASLFWLGFDGVQGRDLNPEDFPYTPEAQALAKTESTCDHA